MNNFHPLEGVGRDSETQLQVSDFFIYFRTPRDIGAQKKMKWIGL